MVLSVEARRRIVDMLTVIDDEGSSTTAEDLMVEITKLMTEKEEGKPIKGKGKGKPIKGKVIREHTKRDKLLQIELLDVAEDSEQSLRDMLDLRIIEVSLLTTTNMQMSQEISFLESQLEDKDLEIQAKDWELAQLMKDKLTLRRQLISETSSASKRKGKGAGKGKE